MKINNQEKKEEGEIKITIKTIIIYDIHNI